MQEFAGKVALVTGTTGIGRAIALRLAAGGAQVVSCGIEASGNDELARDASKNALTLQVETCDVTNIEQVRSVIAKTVGRLGGLDIMVNAAAIHPFGTVLETDLATWNRCMMVNVGSIYLLAHLGVPELKKRGGGSIINLASVQGYACQRGVVAYAASKGAINTLTRYVATQYGPRGIRCNALVLGLIATPVLKATMPEPLREIFRDNKLTARLGEPRDVAEMVVFLASDRSRYITGQLLPVDGGFYAHTPTSAPVQALIKKMQS